MWTTSYTHHTPAAPDAVWTVLADIPRWGDWNAGIETIEVDGPVGVGTTFRMTPPGEEPLLSTVETFVPGRELTDVTEVEGIVVRVTHVVRPDAGGSLVTYAVEVSGPAPDEVLARIGAGASADFPDVLAALAAQAAR